MNYWQKRLIDAQEVLANKSVKQIEKQLKNYYTLAMNHCLDSFESTYYKLMATVEDEGREPTPADLYKLDKYWTMQAQVRDELEKLGERELALLSRQFETYYFNVYYSIHLDGVTQTFNTLDKTMVQQAINSIWCADGKQWSQRVWDNMDLLRQTLNEGIVDIVAAGKRNKELKNMLQERFGVSYTRADSLVRTEVAHIQTQAAKKRYEDYGLKEYEILGNEDDTCITDKKRKNKSVDCHEMHGKKFLYAEMAVGKNAPPFHPRCKCCIVPVL